MQKYKVIVCSDIPNQEWRWISHHFEEDVSWTFVRVKPSNNKWMTKFYRGWAGLKTAVLALKHDVIVSHGVYIAFYCALFKWLFKVSAVHIVYSFNFAQLPVGLAKSRMRFLFKRLDRIVVSAHMEKSLYAEYFAIPEEKIDYVMWGVNKPDFELKPRILDEKYICTVGGNARDYATFMAAMTALPDIKAIAVVRPHNLINLAVPQNVKVLTNIPLNDALSIIQNSLFMVLPLTSSATPCGHVTIVAAMYLGIPCIVTNSSGIDDYITQDETGVLCQPDSSDSMRKAIERLWSNEALRKKIAGNIQVFASKYCSETNYVEHFRHFLIKNVNINR